MSSRPDEAVIMLYVKQIIWRGGGGKQSCQEHWNFNKKNPCENLSKFSE